MKDRKKGLFLAAGLPTLGAETFEINPPTKMMGQPGKPIRQVLLEALAVLAAGLVLALVANRVSPRGLVLTRNYFPAGIQNPVTASPALLPGANPSATQARLLAARLQEQGLQLADGPLMTQWFHDPRYAQGGVVFIDARDEQHYLEGHIPGAYEFDPYHPEKYFATVLPVCQKADLVVAYCNGGDCDDSESAAVLLRDVGIPKPKLFVYGGGITEWTTNGLPIEVGARNSGNVRPPKP